MKSLIISVILFGLIFHFTIYSNENIISMIIPILILLSILGTLAISIWIEGSFWERQLNSAKIAIPSTAAVFLIGYIFATLKVMI